MILCGGGNIPIDREVAEEGLNFSASHLSRVSLSVEKNVPLYPGGVSLFGSDRIILEANGISNLIEELYGRIRHDSFLPCEAIADPCIEGVARCMIASEDASTHDDVNLDVESALLTSIQIFEIRIRWSIPAYIRFVLAHVAPHDLG